MISQKDLPAYIGKAVPELSGICEKEDGRNIYYVVKELLKYTSRQVLRHNMNAAHQCLLLVEKLHKKGNAMIRNAIENVFVYSFSHSFFHNEDDRKKVMDIIPLSLYDLYKQQVINSHL